MNAKISPDFFIRPLKNLWAPVVLGAALVSCQGGSESLTAGQSAIERDSIQRMTMAIAREVSQDGPAAWLRYFEASPGFYMASEGENLLPDIDSARHFINTVLIKNIRSIQLSWHDIRIDPYTPTLAGIAAGYHEDLTDNSGKTISEDGYFTAMAENSSSAGWQLRNAHWSVIPNK